MQPVIRRGRSLRQDRNQPGMTCRKGRTSALRAAFSMIELVVVVLIISILASMILVGVRGAIKAVNVTSVVNEFKGLEKSLQDFKSKFGTYPPSGIMLYEASAGWTGSAPSAAAVSRSRALIRQMWPDFDFTIARDINGDGDTTDTIMLNGSECLVFFLGGVNATNVVNRTGGLIGTVNDEVTQWEPLGFSTNPLNPLARGGTRLGPYHEFDVARLANRDSQPGTPDTEGFPELRDLLPGQSAQTPILYGSAYEGKGYRDADIALSTQPAYNAYSTAPTSFAYAYRRYTGTTFPATVANFNNSEAFNSKTFQLISPGFDGEYGWGGVLSTDMELTEPRTERNVERDNITNFKGGMLN